MGTAIVDNVETGGTKNVPFFMLDNSQFIQESSPLVHWFVQPEDGASSLRQFCVILTAESDGEFSVEAPQLPGVFSQGSTEKEAIDNIREAIIGTIESYEEDGADIPWAADWPAATKNQRQLWIVLDVQTS